MTAKQAEKQRLQDSLQEVRVLLSTVSLSALHSGDMQTNAAGHTWQYA